MDLINDKDLVATLLRLKSNLLNQCTDMLDTVVGRCIELYDVE